MGNEELAIIWENDEATIEQQEADDAEISLHALVGSKGPQTIKVKAHIKNRPVKVLVDSGSTHNFVSQGLVK